MKRLMIATLIVLALSGCECDSRVNRVQPALAVNDASIDFGLVALGDEQTQTLRLRAMTSADVFVTIRLEENDTGVFKLQGPVPEFVPGGGFIDLKLVFAPNTADVFAATLDIEAADVEVERKRHRVLLSGEGSEVRMSVQPETLVLSATACPPNAHEPRCGDSAVVTVRNEGVVPLRIDAVEMSSQPVVANLVLAKPLVQRTLVPGEDIDVELSWTPDESQAGSQFEGVLQVRSNARQHAVVEVPVVAMALANEPPLACIEVISIARRAYELDDEGRPAPTVLAVPPEDWWTDQFPSRLRVRPGYTIRTSTGPSEGAERCTFDPEGAPLTMAWALEGPPHARVSPIPSAGRETEFEIDAAGEYELTLEVFDSLGQRASATLGVSAISHDDVFVELSWVEGEPEVDLDLHLLTDGGPWRRVNGDAGSYGPASLFCEQDTFFFNPHPELFDEQKTTDNPWFLRDDQGTAGRLESISLEEAPAGSRFKVAVHYFSGDGEARPAVSVRLRGEDFGPFVPSTPLTGVNDVWFGAEIIFPQDGTSPTATALDSRTSNETPVRVGVCE